ncbi:Wzz/FepE/Etk N-terminal domain-containing protein [Colwellia sp. 1_MG-2023]|uniref:Wzz/FepE/Etk N-terminal domain-containing protein n=1 Tax=Colwellia sp. 1_MG-2023 TaxID=3062649 RepID=UPI0026E323F5|nr:Wzz/FepE/Etk N-terminal domain-containing protein [Colwellia sp. 1_MG-2023]MDO6444322.1 Wzz/FepE/Etk N-terminal domain-containing protein [Colwellia sp. 1_MG-2023]
MIKQEENIMQDEEVNFSELWRILWARKITIIGVTIVFSVAAIFFALSKPNIYKASVILTPVSSEGGVGGLASLAGKFGGLASMAGINLGSGGSDKTTLALEIIKSRSFLESFISKHNLLVPLMAASHWDDTTDELILDGDIYDQANNKWLRDVKAPKTPKPSLWEAYREFSDILYIDYDKKAATIVIDIEYYSPKLAQQWLEWLIADLNAFMSKQDFEEAQASINYLNKELSGIKVKAMETVFYQLIEEQTKNMMLISVKPEYVLKTIDPPQVPEERAKPNRGLIVILGTILGGMLSVFMVLLQNRQSK